MLHMCCVLWRHRRRRRRRCRLLMSHCSPFAAWSAFWNRARQTMCNTANIRDFSRAQAIHTIKTQLINNVPRMPTTPCARWPTANKWSISMQRRRRRRRVWNTTTQPVWRICCAGAHRTDLCANVCKFVHVSRTQAVAFTWSAHVRAKPDRFYIMSAGAPMMLTLCARKCAHANTENKPTLSIRSRSMRRCRSSCEDNDNRVMHATYTQIAGSLVLAVAGRGLVSGWEYFQIICARSP